jgi:Transposase DDE domain group 1
MSWCEENRVDYVLGLARNPRLVASIRRELVEARAEARRTKAPARRFKDFTWATRNSWRRERRVIAKAEWTSGKTNPRFVVTSLKKRDVSARFLYEKLYCARGDMVA